MGLEPKLQEERREAGEYSWVGGSVSGCWGHLTCGGLYVGQLWFLQSQDKPVHHLEVLLAPNRGPSRLQWLCQKHVANAAWDFRRLPPHVAGSDACA